MAFLGKEFKFVKDENFDGFLKSVGLGAEEVAKLSQYRPSTKLEKDGDSYTFTSTSPARTKVVKFKPGVEQDDEIKEGLVVKSTYTVDGNVVTQVIKHEDKVTTFKREYNGDSLKVTITSNFWDGVCNRYYSA
ncbi:fatty acid-binding protein 1-like [Plodia interpunctella]|uniref:fatty acid-binding protein 1-like n=1 Tax=Plodia interpunctella TaxID=58824 RepID=UPI00236859A9|nr:fatty acid-binding protein 1-like [Plodia interpunctella]